MEESFSDIINNPFSAEDHSEATTYLTENSTQGTYFEDDSYKVFAPASRQNTFNIICGTDINKKPISITFFHGSCFNDFHRHFRKA